MNGKTHNIDADPDMPLLYALRNDVGLNNPKFGCGLAQCGACTVHLDGKRDPLLRHAGVVGRRRQGRDARRPRHAGEAAPAADRLRRGAGPQCGYCINGWVMTAAAFLATKKKPSDAEIKQALEGAQVPLRHPHVSIMQGGQARRRDDGLREDAMTKMDKTYDLLPPRGAEGRRRLRGLDRRAGRPRHR